MIARNVTKNHLNGFVRTEERCTKMAQTPGIFTAARFARRWAEVRAKVIYAAMQFRGRMAGDEWGKKSDTWV